MNKHIQQLINAFTPTEIIDSDGINSTGIDTSKEFIYRYKYFPKTNKELAQYVKDLLDAGETNLNAIDTSKITDFSKIFIGQLSSKSDNVINIDVRFWDVSNGKNFSCMFFNCSNFNADLSQWDVSDGRKFNAMFFNCKMFNSDLSQWDMHNAIDVSNMFLDCTSFNSDLSKWDVSNVEDFQFMLAGCKNFKPCFDNWNIQHGKRKTNNMFIGIERFTMKKAIQFAKKWDLDLDKFYIAQN